MSIFGAAPRVAHYVGLLWTQRHGGEQVVDLFAALVDADEMSPDDADAWLARFRLAEADDGEPVPELADRVEAVVERSLAEVHQARDRWLTGQQTIAAVVALGAVPPEKFQDWYRRLGSLAAPPPAAQRLDEQELHARRRAAAARAGELVRVIAGPVKLGEAMQVTSVEIYEGTVALRWHYNSDDARFPPARDWHGIHFRIADELGTEYIGRGGAASRLDRHEEDFAAVSGRDVFIPVPPPGVSALLIEYDGNEGRIQLRD